MGLRGMPSSNDWGYCTCEAACLATAARRKIPGEPDARNVPVRFDEGGLGCYRGGAQSSTLLASSFDLPRTRGAAARMEDEIATKTRRHEGTKRFRCIRACGDSPPVLGVFASSWHRPSLLPGCGGGRAGLVPCSAITVTHREPRSGVLARRATEAICGIAEGAQRSQSARAGLECHRNCGTGY